MTDKVIPVHMYLSNQASYTKISCQTISRNTFITEESCSRSFAYKCLLISMLSNICITNNILIPGYSWNTAKFGVKHHSMNNILTFSVVEWFASSTVDRGFKQKSGQTKDYIIDVLLLILFGPFFVNKVNFIFCNPAVNYPCSSMISHGSIDSKTFPLFNN
jgi:hypothetical protein